MSSARACIKQFFFNSWLAKLLFLIEASKLQVFTLWRLRLQQAVVNCIDKKCFIEKKRNINSNTQHHSSKGNRWYAAFRKWLYNHKRI